MMINSEASANGISIHALREEGDGQNTNNYSQVR